MAVFLLITLLPLTLQLPSAFHAVPSVRTSTVCLAAMSGYARTPGDDASIDVAEVERLLCERTDARSVRNWNAADAIRDTLSGMGVIVRDQEKTWSVSNDAFDRPTGRAGRRYDSGGRTASSDERRIDLNDDRAYTRAEFIQEYGGAREWDMSMPPKTYSPPPSSQQYSDQPTDDWRQRRRERDARRMATRSKPYARAAECTASLDAAAVRDIEELVKTRLQRKLDRRFEEADAMLAELEARGVSVSDDTRAWRADGLSFVYSYRGTGGAAGRSTDEVAQVESLVQQRGVAKSFGQYEESDRLADELYDLGVDLDDKARSWSFVYAVRGAAGGGGGGGGGVRKPTNHDYRRDRSDDYSLRPEELEKVDALLGKRLAAKKARDFDRADALQAELRGMGVEVDDKQRVWYVRYHDGGRAASSFNVRGW